VTRKVLDVGALPAGGFGHRAPLWWGIMLAVAIEATMLLLLAIGYGYIRDRTAPWPPVLAPRLVAWIATVDLALLVLSAVPMQLASRAAVRDRARGMRNGLLVATGLGIASLLCRWAIFERLPFRWDANAYASAVWALIGLQSFHVLTGVVDNALFLARLAARPVTLARRIEVQASTPLWYFVIAGAALVWALVFVEIFVHGGAR
jgi:heme/copper-type cytochrome/quinol oxidase subunit 3